MQTLRKKTSPLKYKNETSRFLGEGVSFKAKLIGILEVSEARGDRMCQEALSDLKTAIRAAGEHKQRITINIAIDGLRLRDEKTGDSLYHHPVHKISFIAQDMTDSRAFGYIFGSPDTGHRFFGIKTDKAASQVVIAMRDLFQVVFALKKKEIELAKQHLDKNRYGTSSLFSETSVSSSKLHSSMQDTGKTNIENKASSSSTERPTPAVADLVDLELELNSLQQGLNQMEKITPSDPFGSKDDPFGDSFTPFPKPILPPPPSSGKDRANRGSESSSVFSPKLNVEVDTSQATPKESNYSQDEPNSGDWFTPPAKNGQFEEPSLVPEPVQDQHEITKKEILSQFDVFTDLDPLGTGKFKPYVDKKHFFQELKNPPKKVLNDLVSESQPLETLTFPTNFEPKKQNNISTSPNLFPSDPFGEDPFVKTDPFAETDFTRQDPFETDGVFNRETRNDFSEQFKFPAVKGELQTLFGGSSPKSSVLEKQMSVLGTSPRNAHFTKQNTFDVQFDDKKFGVMQLHENPSLDLSSESECAPDPPPRPTNNLAQIKPPPLPPKKQLGETCIKPPPRPPHTEDVHYDFIDSYETAPNSLEYARNLEKSPPLPVPARKTKFESDFMVAPERPKKQFNAPAEEDEYLTPVSIPKSKNDWQEINNDRPILLPPPQKANRKNALPNLANVTVASYLETKPNITTSMSGEKNSFDGLNITLSQLTLSGLNQLALKLDIPASQLSNMTLVQLTSYLSNFIKGKTNEMEEAEGTFQADFANFNNFNKTSETYDRYAVFRELLQDEIKQTKIDSEPQEIMDEKEQMEENEDDVRQKINNNANREAMTVVDKYAALREIVEIEIKQNGKDRSIEENDKNEEEEETSEQNNLNECNKLDEQSNIQIENEANINNTEKFIGKDNAKDKVIEYSTPLDIKKASTPIRSPVKSPINKAIKSPVPVAITEIVQNNTRLTSGSLSDVISGSSPEIDNTGSASEVTTKKDNDTTGESWAIFDQPNLVEESPREKQNVQSEEGVSPWSSDSKEFGNASPPDWRPRTDSASGDEQWSRRRRDQEGWWDTSAEPEVQYYPANRRSTDSYGDEYYTCYDRPRRRRQGHWSSHVGQVVGGGHSSSSRDVSPWEEEPSRRRELRDHREHRDGKQMWMSRHGRQHSFERHKDRRNTDSWDEEDDFEYEEEHSNRFHWQERHGVRETERDERWADDWSEDRKHRRRREMDRERWCCPDWDQGETDKPSGRYASGGRWADAPPVKWRERKHEERKQGDRYYSRDSQDSPWEDEYPNEPDEAHLHYLTAKRNWKRPSSASEMDRKTGEIKPRQYALGTGGSDGERDRRYKSNRRSKSRESQFSDTSHNRHKPDPGLTLRTRPKHHHVKGHFEADFLQDISSKKIEGTKPELASNKKPVSGAIGRKKSKDSLKSEDVSAFLTRKSTMQAQSLFENDFVLTETESPISACMNQRFTFENDFETSEAESPTIAKSKSGRQKTYHSKDVKSGSNKNYNSDFNRDARTVKTSLKSAVRYQTKQKSLFEDDFSPTEKTDAQHETVPSGISSIKEEANTNEEEENNTFGTNNFCQGNGSRKKILSKNRLSVGLRSDAANLKKSESVNIFGREDDPFDDDFFSGRDNNGGDVTVVSSSSSGGARGKHSQRMAELKWTEQFHGFDTHERK